MRADSKSALVPRLRFPEFRGGDEWTLLAGDAVFDQINNKNPEPGLPVLAITQEHGAIPRRLIDYHVSVSDKSIESYKVVRIGDFIISLRSFQGGIEYSNYDGICSPAYVILRRRGKGSDHYFRHYLKTERFIRLLTKNIEGLRDGKMISYAQFSDVMLPVPKPTEQKRIADCLTSLDEAITAQARKVDALKKHKKGLMQQLFPREGETHPRLRFPEFRGEENWSLGRIADIATVLQGYGFPERHQGQTAGDYPFYKVSDISRSLAAGKILIDGSANYVNQILLKELKAKPIPVGATIFAKIGEAIRSNKRAITSVPCLIDNNTAGVKAIRGKATDLFIYFLMEQISLIDHAGGVVPAVNKSAIEEILIRFPGIEEQSRIASCLNSLDAVSAAELQKLEALKRHKSGLAHQLFPAMEGDNA